jgi:hypothetical protein
MRRAECVLPNCPGVFEDEMPLGAVHHMLACTSVSLPVLWRSNRLLCGLSKPCYLSSYSDVSGREYLLLLPFLVTGCMPAYLPVFRTVP